MSNHSRFCVAMTLLFCLYATAASDSESPWSSMLSAVESCLPSPSGLTSCLKSKALHLLDRAIATDGPLALTEYLSLSQDGPSEKTDGRSARISVPDPDLSDEAALDEALKDRLSKLLSTRTLRLTIPGKDIVEGRRKKNKGMGMLMMAALAMKGMMLQMAMGKIAMIAGKALMIGKMALLLSVIVGLRKLVGGGQQSEHPQVVYATESHHGGGWSRQLDRDGQAMAYRGQAPLSQPANEI